MKEQPLVSIMIPVYNGSNYIAQAIDSALAQTYPNYEIIVINDGSEDEGRTRQVCMQYGQKVRYFEKENGGCASALNYGIRQAKGDFISWLSHDDLYDPKKLEKQIDQYDKHNLDRQNTIICNAGRLIDEQGKTIFHPKIFKAGLFSSLDLFERLLYDGNFNGCGLLIPKSLFDKGLYFREDMCFVLDRNLWLRFAVHGAQAYISRETLVSNRQHVGQVTVKQNERRDPEQLLSCKQLFELLQGQTDLRYMIVLYYYCYATDKALATEVEAFLKEKNVKISKAKQIWYRQKANQIQFAKKLYRKIRKLIYSK